MSLFSNPYLNANRIVDNRATLCMLFFLALGAIALSLWQGISYFQGKAERAILMQNAVDTGLKNLEEQSGALLSGNFTALNVVANSYSLGKLSNENQTLTAIWQGMLAALIQASPNAYQARFIDINGDEKIRVEKHADGSIEKSSVLQNKFDRDYFSEAMALQKGQMYVSNINLNIENDQIQTPWIPTVRLAIPVYDDQGVKIGILVINLDVSGVLNIYSSRDKNSRVEIKLINSDGYWLYGQPKEQLWGFMFANDQTLAATDSVVWNQLQQGGDTHFENDNGRWTYLTTTVETLFPNTVSYSAPNKVLWHAVVRDPPQPLPLSPTGYIPTVVILLALLAFSWAWTKSILERRRTESELVKAEKLSSLGGLVAGVAHELNTPIGSAVTISSTLQDQARELWQEIETGQLKKSKILEFVKDVRYASDIVLRGLNRANELIGHFKQIAVDQSGEHRREFLLDDYIEEMSVTFQHLFKNKDIHLALDLNSQAKLDTYPGPLSQVVINLVQNALIHGFHPNESGTIRISTSPIDAEHACLVISDNGCGIPNHLIDRVFDPFFTTKLGQGGSGLGLHIVHNIVTDILKGSLTVESDQSCRETKFIINIPCLPQKELSSSNNGDNHAQPEAA